MTTFRPVSNPHSEAWRREAGPLPAAGARGTLVIVGGSERLDKELHILQTYLRLVDAVPGRRDLVLLTAATGHPEILGGEYHRLFTALGVPAHHIHMPEVATRESADHPATAALLRGAAGIYMTGGDQVALMDVLHGTAVEAALCDAYVSGAVIGGTSAGATAMGDPMIARGGGSGELRRGMVTIRRGLGLLGEHVFVDTHFGERGRFPRMCAALAEAPQVLGVGIDENTGLVLHPGARVVEVIGRGVVYFLDGHATAPVDVALGSAFSLTPLSLHVLTEGARYDLAARRPVSEAGVGNQAADTVAEL